jgi:UDP-3-O-[3-hydroxymyristoyl] N-acetylglucosamine deacetylase
MKICQLTHEVSCSGIGIHTGAFSEIKFMPSDKEGIQFFKDGIRIPAKPEFVVKTKRGVVLGKDGISVQTVEHLLAAVRWLGISSLEVQIKGEEIPILDGSSSGWIDLIEPHLNKTSRDFSQVFIKKSLLIEQTDAFIKISPSNSFSVQYTIDFPFALIGTQVWQGEISPEIFKSEIAPARTFGFMEEIDSLRKERLTMGGNLENCVVITKDSILTPLRYKDEPIRHKVLDFLGDLSLLSWHPVGKFEIFKGGHSLHVLMAETLENQIQ